MKKLRVMGFVSGIVLILSMALALSAFAGGPPMKENPCGVCHKDFKALRPKTHPDVGPAKPCLTCHVPDPSRAEANKFSTTIHKIHKGGKTTLECGSCHAI